MRNKIIDIEGSILNHINQSVNTLKSIPSELSGDINKAVKLIIQTFSNGHKLLIAGNGGSAADAQHIAAEFVVRLSKELERPALPAIALSTDSSILTASSNDNGFRTVFSRQLEALAQKGDCFLAISTSGNSENLVTAVEFAKKENIKTIGLLGNNGGTLQSLVDIAITVRQYSTQHVQEAHICIYHIMCDLVERSMYT